MVFVPFAYAAQVQIRGLLDGQHICNTLGFEKDSEIDTPMLAQLAYALADWWGANAPTLLPPSYTFSEVYTYALDIPESISATSGLGAGWLGTQPGAILNNASTLAIKFSTAKRGRSYTGRNYWPGFTTNSVNGNYVTDTMADAIVALYSQLLVWDPLDFPEGWTWAVLSRYNLGSPRLVGWVQPITAVSTTDRTIDTQRRRLPGRGL
jgi:hypothetical protein